MIDENRSTAVLTQVADQLLDVVNELLEVAGGSSSDAPSRMAAVLPFRAEMRRYESNGDFVDLSDIEARILEVLLRNKGRLVTKAQLCEVLNLDPQRQDRNLKSYVYRLKCKLRRMSQSGLMIRPIHGAGYVLTETKQESAAMSSVLSGN